MKARAKWMWIITGANAAVLVLLILELCVIMFGLALLAPDIPSWPLFTLLAVGVPLSVVGLKSSAGVVSRPTRLANYLVHGIALAVDLVIVTGVAAIFIFSTKEQIVIPDGFKGDVYIIHGAADGEASRTRWGVTYRIPQDGILRVREPMLRGWTSREYYYERRDGTLERIRNFWPSTIHPTAENLANDRDFGVYFPRTGTLSANSGCSFYFEQFYVGTKAHLLSKYREIPIALFLRDHPVECAK